MNQPTPARKFGDHLVFVDESGDHGIKHFGSEYPVFVLLFVIVRKDNYVDRVCPEVQCLKLDFWGHDAVVLHEADIRKPKGPFRILFNEQTRDRFLSRVDALIAELPMKLVAVVIDKQAFARQYSQPVGLYDFALEIGLERVFRELGSPAHGELRTHVLVEARGRREDDELELAFRRICAGINAIGRPFPFDVVFVPKAANSIGLQLADLMARPIGMHYIRPGQSNRAYETISKKLRRSPAGKVEGWGLKVLP